MDKTRYITAESCGSDFQGINNLYSLLPVEASRYYTLNLENAGFFKPVGVMALLLMARRIAEQSGHPLRVANLDDQLLAYLERVNLFQVADKWLQLDVELPEQLWDRNPQSSNLLELTPINNASDVATIMARTESIFRRWLQLSNLNSLLKILSELCSNVYQHSGDPYGFVMIQRYQYTPQGETDVVLVVGDVGNGIRHTLKTKYPELGDDPLNYIQAALEGYTSRNTGRGGLGLRTVEETVQKEGGHVWLRSESDAICSYGSDHRYTSTSLPFMPGTQVVVEFRAKIRD